MARNSPLSVVGEDYVEPISTDTTSTTGGGGGTYDGMEPRVAKLESEMTDIKVLLGKIEVRLDNIDRGMTTRADLSDAERRISEKVAAVETRVGVTEGELKRTLGVWQFLGIMALAVGLIVKWPTVSTALGL